MIIYDIEIVKAIPPKNEEDRIEGIEYCEGWHDHTNMDIACICAYDYETNRYRVFTNTLEFLGLVWDSNRTLIGFNNINFDNKVIRADSHHVIDSSICYDILQKIWAALGHGPEFNHETHAGYGLDACCKANFGLGKTDWGGNAPVLWQQGRYGEVIDYCLEDVRLTKMLFEKIDNDKYIINPKDPDKVIYF